ncbi:MAG: polysaccharide biosynthesis/export family protein, partial [Acidobacteriota bacterium]|nr:polysaccharide biosynthesis/export family protein [Acidobacteriota bacterium]
MNKPWKHAITGVLTILALAVSFALAEEPEQRRHVPLTVDDVLKAQGQAKPVKKEADLNERLRAMAGASRFSQDYLLGPGDVIQVTVFGIEDLNKLELSLDSKGAVTLPFVGAVNLEGLTVRESEVKVATLYEASVIKNPQVGVTVKEYRSQFVNVLGAVLKPGTYQLTRRVFLLDALAMAG